MRPTRGARAVLLLVLTTFLGGPIALGAMATAADASVPTVEAQMLALTNHDRAKAGLAPLVSSSTLVSIARSWSAHMAATGQLVHDPSLASKVSGWSTIGENIGYAYSASQAETMFMNSAPHRANILKAGYNRVGIGVSKDSQNRYWFTIDFEQTSGYHPPPATHTTHKTAPTHSSTRTSASTRSTQATRASRSAVRPTLAHVPAVVPAVAPLTATATGRMDVRLAAMDQRLSSHELPLPIPSPGFRGPDPRTVAVIVTGGLLVTALAGFATTRPPRVRVRGLPGGR